ncbi:MAG: 2-amino-4-hydroxy-6-hydroxymethyldihydropteridine diphosphokinase [Gammaproteobacteria bacterium]
MTRVYVSIGSNIEPERNVRSGVAALARRYAPLAVSTVYETDPVGFQGDPFYNLVVAFDTQETPPEVLGSLRGIEDDHGRDRAAPRFSPRSLDLDLLLYGDLVRREPGLHLPRPELTHYAFVLGPLAEIAGGVRHPELGRTFGDLWAAYGAGRAALRRVSMRPLDTVAEFPMPEPDNR